MLSYTFHVGFLGGCPPKNPLHGDRAREVPVRNAQKIT